MDSGLLHMLTVTVLAIDDHGKARVSVELDAAKDDKPQTVSFVVGENSKAGEFNSFKHGYAGTIYRGQGRTLDEAYVAHSAQWRSAASYVALTRHRERVHIFAARETVKSLDDMARGMARTDNKRAATAYSIDPHSAARAELDRVEAGISERPAAVSVKEAKEATTDRGERLRQREDRQARDEITRNQRQRGERDLDRKGPSRER